MNTHPRPYPPHAQKSIRSVTLEDSIVPGDHRMLDANTMYALGVAGTTPVFIRRLTDKERTIGLSHGDTLRPEYEVRMGFALLGHTNMRPEDFEACGHDPFHEDFMDNFAVGTGSTPHEAMASMIKEMESISQGLFA